MVKTEKQKLKLVNKSPKGEKAASKLGGKIKKKKVAVKDHTAVNKKGHILKELATKNSDLVDLKENYQLRSGKSLVKQDWKPPQPKQKPVEKQKKRQKTQIDDTKMLLKLMKKK